MTRRITVFAHYDKDNIIDDYVINYLKGLKEVSESLIFVSDGELSDIEKSKLCGLADFVIAEKHGEYDFGSYKRGVLKVKEQNLTCEELILANDSCYGPLFSLKKVFDEMHECQCDFWGITENKYGIKGKERHIQSYFLVFKTQILEDESFVQFFKNVSVEEFKNDVITKYEIGLSKMLFDKGFVGESYVKKYRKIGNATIYKWRELVQKRLSPFVKCSLLKLKNTERTTVSGWENVIDKCDYDVNLIKNHLKRFDVRLINNRVPMFLKRVLFQVGLLLPNNIRIKYFLNVQRFGD